jgi:signal transduction histidine kinase
VPLEVVVDTGSERYPTDVESAVYFCSLEALQNAAKHARASRAEVHVARRDGHLEFTICDNGIGFDLASVRHGSGLRNMRERVSAAGGYITIQSEPRRGTIVRGAVALPTHERAAVA